MLDQFLDQIFKQFLNEMFNKFPDHMLDKLLDKISKGKLLIFFADKILFRFVKCGYAGSHFPAHIFPSMVKSALIEGAVKILIMHFSSYSLCFEFCQL